MHLQIALHDLGKQVGKNEHLALALVGMGKIAQSFANELAVHLAFVVAHLLIADGDADVTPAQQEFLDDGKHGLTAGGAGVLHGFYGLAGQARQHCHQAGEQTLLVKGNIAGGTDRANIQRGGLDADLAASAVDRVLDDLWHRHGHELSEFRLMVGGDVNTLHKTPLIG